MTEHEIKTVLNALQHSSPHTPYPEAQARHAEAIKIITDLSTKPKGSKAMTEHEFAMLRPGSKVVVISSRGEWDHCLIQGRIYTVTEIDTSCDGLRLSSQEDWHVVDQWIPREETEFLKL